MPASLSAALRERSDLVGCVTKMPSAPQIEALGWLGYDLVILDTEHGSADTADLENHLHAADGVGLPVLVRVYETGPEIGRALDAGASGIVIPHVRGAHDADAAVAAAHYPPRGTRGLATSTRAGRQAVTGLTEHLDRARSATVIVAQLEDGEAVANAETIAATAGIDAVWIGLNDLSMSLGHPGALDHPVVAEALAAAIAGVSRAGKPLIIQADDNEAARAWRERGAAVLLATAPGLIRGAFERYLTALRQ